MAFKKPVSQCDMYIPKVTRFSHLFVQGLGGCLEWLLWPLVHIETDFYWSFSSKRYSTYDFFYVTLWRTVQIWRDLLKWRVHYLGSIGLRRRSPVLIEILSKKSACLQKLYHKRASTKHIHINVKLPDQEPCPHDELGPFCQRTWQYPVTQCQSSYPWALYYLVVQLSLHDVVPVLQKAS